MSEAEGANLYTMTAAFGHLLTAIGFEPAGSCGGDEPCLGTPWRRDSVVLDRWARKHDPCPGPQPAEKVADTQANREAMKARVVNVIEHFGGEAGWCRSCGERIWWVTTKNDRKAPYQADARSHFAACPAAARHRSKR